MANDKVYIFDEENIRINVYEGGQTDLTIVNDSPIIEVVKIYEPGPQGPKGNDGGEYVLPANVVSSSNQISSDISGSFTQLSSSFQSRISTFENKTLFSSSQQLPNNLVSGSEQLTQSYDQRYHRLGTNLFSSSQQVQYSQISNVPSGILSSSQGFVLSSQTS